MSLRVLPAQPHSAMSAQRTQQSPNLQLSLLGSDSEDSDGDNPPALCCLRRTMSTTIGTSTTDTTKTLSCVNGVTKDDVQRWAAAILSDEENIQMWRAKCSDEAPVAGALQTPEDVASCNQFETLMLEHFPMLRLYEGSTAGVGEGGRVDGHCERNAVVASLAVKTLLLATHFTTIDGAPDLVAKYTALLNRKQHNGDTLLGVEAEASPLDEAAVAAWGDYEVRTAPDPQALLASYITLVAHDLPKIVDVSMAARADTKNPDLDEGRVVSWALKTHAAGKIDASFLETMCRCFEQGLELAQFVQLECSDASLEGAKSLIHEAPWFYGHYLLDTAGLVQKNPRGQGDVPDSYVASPIVNKTVVDLFLRTLDALSSEESVATAYLKYWSSRIVGCKGVGALVAAFEGHAVSSDAVARAFARTVGMARITGPARLAAMLKCWVRACDIFGVGHMAALVSGLAETGLDGSASTTLVYAPLVLNNAAKGADWQEHTVLMLGLLAATYTVGPFRPGDPRGKVDLNWLANMDMDKKETTAAAMAWKEGFGLLKAGSANASKTAMETATKAVALHEFYTAGLPFYTKIKSSMVDRENNLFVTRDVVLLSSTWSHDGQQYSAVQFPAALAGDDPHCTQATISDPEVCSAVCQGLFARALSGETEAAGLLHKFICARGITCMHDVLCNDVDDYLCLKAFEATMTLRDRYSWRTTPTGCAFYQSLASAMASVEESMRTDAFEGIHTTVYSGTDVTFLASKLPPFADQLESSIAAGAALYVQGGPTYADGDKPSSNLRDYDRSDNDKTVELQSALFPRTTTMFLDMPRAARASRFVLTDGALTVELLGARGGLLASTIGCDADPAVVKKYLERAYIQNLPSMGVVRRATAGANGASYVADGAALMMLAIHQSQQ